MKRRDFVVGTGVVVGAGLLATSVVREPSMEGRNLPAPETTAPFKAMSGHIDIHNHIVSPALHKLLQERKATQLAGVSVAPWTLQGSLESMQQNEVQTAITSVVIPGISLERAQLAAFSRSSNEYSAGLSQQYPDRFGFFAHIPLPFTDEACAEAIYALDELRADGVVLMASNQDKFLGDPAFEPLMSELDRRKATVFVHPNQHPSTQQLGLATPTSVLEYSCDLTRAGLNLILSGTMERYPNIRWILAHAGGFLPYVAWRVSLANAMPEYGDKATLGVLNYLRRFYFDTASSVSRYSMATLRELVEPSRILFGSDSPFTVSGQTLQQIEGLKQENFWAESMVAGVLRGHALSLFPRLKVNDEAIAAAPSYRQEQLTGQLKRQLMQPLQSLAQRLRD